MTHSCAAPDFADAARAHSPAMARNMSDDFRRPVPLALAALAIVGWLLVSYFWSQAADLRAQMDDGMKRAELAREGLAADLQNLQKAAGNAADLDKQAKDAQAALAEAVSARAAAQNELAELTKQISEAKLAVSGAQEEANAKSRDLQSVDAKLQGGDRPARRRRGPDHRRAGEIRRPRSTDRGRHPPPQRLAEPGRHAAAGGRRRQGGAGG